MPAPKLNRVNYTYQDYLSWSDKDRCEIIGGSIRAMSPSPNTQHQRISLFLSTEIAFYLRSKECEAFTAPFDVRLPEVGESEEEASNVVQPDILVICDPSKIKKQGAVGTPDLVVEILSPGTALVDLEDKYQLYERHGVREYWIVHTHYHFIEVFRLDEKGVYVSTGKFTDSLTSTVLSDLKIDLTTVFDQ